MQNPRIPREKLSGTETGLFSQPADGFCQGVAQPHKGRHHRQVVREKEHQGLIKVEENKLALQKEIGGNLPFEQGEHPVQGCCPSQNL